MRRTLIAGLTMACLTLPALAVERMLSLTVGRSEVLRLGESITRVAISDPHVADVVVLPDREVLVNGKAGGTASLMVWTKTGRQVYQVSVGQDIDGLLPTLTKITGSHDLAVHRANDTLILQGTVPTEKLRTLAEKVASAYAPKVISQLDVPPADQIEVTIKVLEIAKTATKELGVTWGTRSISDLKGGNVETFQFQPLQSAFKESGPLAALTGLGGLLRDPLTAKLDLMIRENKAKLLARPTLVANSGSQAKFLAGGEIPIPVQQALGMTTILWKEYGIRLEAEPTLLDDGKIQLKLKPEVSSLDFTNGITINNFKVPALRTRKAETEVRLAPSESLAIGGLLSNEDAHNVIKLPLIGEVPILGELFKSHQFLNGETELMIIVTPQLVHSSRQEPAAMQMHTDELRQLLPKADQPVAVPAPPAASVQENKAPNRPAKPIRATTGSDTSATPLAADGSAENPLQNASDAQVVPIPASLSTAPQP